MQDSLEQTAARLPGKVALVCEERRLTYAEIDAASNRLANALIERGLERGDRVCVCLNNGPEAVIAIFSILKAGGVFVVVSHTTKLEKLANTLNNCAAKGLVLDGKKAVMLAPLVARVPTVGFAILAGEHRDTPRLDLNCADFDRIQASYPADRPSRVNIDLDLACVIYTSGSTGEPKGVMVDHSNAAFVSSSVASYLGLIEDDVVLSVLPLSFSYGLYQVFLTFQAGGRLVLERSFAYVGQVLQRAQTERATGLPGVPTMFATLLHMDLSAYDFSSVRFITNAAAAIPSAHLLQLRKLFPTARLYSMYGQTETKRTLYLPPEQLDARPDSVGIAIPGTEVWLEDEAGNRLGPGQIGELIVRGRHVARGYWSAPEETAKRFRPGELAGDRVYCSGDLFRMDGEGYLYFVARKDDLIKSGGEKVAPHEIENVLHGLAGVVEATVIGVPDPMLGQAVKAFIVPNGIPLTRQIVQAHCKAHLEDHMVPKYVEFRAELPKTASGKIRKQELT